MSRKVRKVFTLSLNSRRVSRLSRVGVRASRLRSLWLFSISSQIASFMILWFASTSL